MDKKTYALIIVGLMTAKAIEIAGSGRENQTKEIRNIGLIAAAALLMTQ